MLCGCVLLNRTRGATAMVVAEELFARWPDPVELGAADPEDVAAVVRPLGFQRRRARALVEFSREWCTMGFYAWLRDEHGDVRQYTGMGDYAQASWDIFQRGEREVETEDPILLEYLATA